jgi:hypothetical protein
MVTRSLVQSAMHTSATALAHLPPEEWPGWIVYLCEPLEDASKAETYDKDAVIRAIADALQERLERGSW